MSTMYKTYQALKRKPLNEMLLLFDNHVAAMSWPDWQSDNVNRLHSKFLRQHGWTWTEYKNATHVPPVQTKRSH